ncbi:MAG: MFS transporter [Acidimicrobiia bacterium]
MHLLRDRRFALLVAGQAVNGIGSWCALVAMWGYATYRFEAGPGQVALIGLAWALPAALLGPIAGVPVDRFGPKRVLVLADLAAAGVAIAMAFVGTFPSFVVLGLLHGATKAFASPAFRALPPRLVDDADLPEANALLSSAMQSSIAFGPLLAAISIQAYGFRTAFVIDAVTYVIGVAAVLPLRTGSVSRTTRDRRSSPSMSEEVREGIAVVRSCPQLLTLLALSTSVYLAWGGYAVVEPVYVRDVLHRSAGTFALLQMTFGCCLLVAGVAVAAWGRGLARLSALAMIAVCTGLAAGLYIGTPYVVVAFVGIGGWGVLTGLFVAPSATVLHRMAPVEAHGRVLALDSALQSWSHVVALGVIGLLAAAVGVQVAGLVAAFAPCVGGLIVLARVRGDTRDETDAAFAA